MPIASWILGAIAVYLLIGLSFGVIFAWTLSGRLDPIARRSPLPVRLLLIPGAMALWPLMIARLRARAAGDRA